MTTKSEYVWNALTAHHNIEWSVDVDDLVRWELSTCDGRDTARKLASRVAKKVKSA